MQQLNLHKDQNCYAAVQVHFGGSGLGLMVSSPMWKSDYSQTAKSKDYYTPKLNIFMFLFYFSTTENTSNGLQRLYQKFGPE